MKNQIKGLWAAFVILLAGSCASEKDYVVTIKTAYGDMKAILYEETPEHKKNFIKLAKEGFYDSLLFHRVIKGFMIQGGDPNSRTASPEQRLGTGGPGYTIPAEFRKEFMHAKGALSAARMPDFSNPERASSGSQFYIVQGKVYNPEELSTDMDKLNQAIGELAQKEGYDSLMGELRSLYNSGDFEAMTKKMLSMKALVKSELGIDVAKTDVDQRRVEAYSTTGGAPHLDDQYTVFGRVVEGLEVIDKIAEQATGDNDRPMKDIRMTIALEETPKKKITEQYGYEYPTQ